MRKTWTLVVQLQLTQRLKWQTLTLLLQQQLFCRLQWRMWTSDLGMDSASESLSPPNDSDSPPTRRLKIQHWARHSEVSNAACGSTGDLGGSSTASASSSLGLLARARVFDERAMMHSQESFWPKTKWGRCPSCEYSLRPHLYQTGPWAGQIRLLCSQFWRIEGGRRQCFQSVAVPADRWADLPSYLKRKHSELPATLRRNGAG